MTNVTPELLAELKAKAEKATKGEWVVSSGDNYYIEADAIPKEYPHCCPESDTGGFLAYIGNRTPEFGEENAEYIAAANPATILALLAHIDSLTEQLAVEKAEHLKECARLDWALGHGATYGSQNDLWWNELADPNDEEIGELNLEQNCTNPRATIDALMKGK